MELKATKDLNNEQVKMLQTLNVTLLQVIQNPLNMKLLENSIAYNRIRDKMFVELEKSTKEYNKRFKK